MPVTAAILLAAGLSQRMQQLKALLPWEGLPLITYQVNTLHEVASQVVVVLGHRREELQAHIPALEGVEVVHNSAYREGRATSIRAGMTALAPVAEHVLIQSVDQPRPSSLLVRLLDAHLEHLAPITVPTYKGRNGHPPIFAARVFKELAQVREETQGLREVMERHRSEVYRVDMGSGLVLLDMNRPEDYGAAWQTWQSANGPSAKPERP